MVYPEWDRLESLSDGVFVGFKGQELYKIKNGKAVRDTRFDNFGQLQYHEYPIIGNYIIEEYCDNHKCAVNIYDLEQNYITTIDNADIIWPNRLHPNILCVRKNFRTGNGTYFQLMDLDNNTVISKDYGNMEGLPDGNYLAEYLNVKGNKIRKYWYVNVNGTATPLPVNIRFPLRHPDMALFYDTEIKRLIVPKGDDGTPGYICDFNGNKIGNLLIDEYYHFRWEVEPVRSSYWKKYIIDK